MGRARATTTVRVRLTDGRIEVTLRRFTPADLEAIKGIPGRRWRPDTRVWVLPRAPSVLNELRRAFGSRLVVHIVPGPSRDPVDLAKEIERILKVMHAELRARDYTRKTERAYLGWTKRFLRFRDGVLPCNLSADDARRFLDHLAQQDIAAKTRNQAASALSFMFRTVFDRDEMAEVPRAKEAARVPSVLSHREVLLVLRELHGKYSLIAALLYSAGLRLEECLRLRVKDIDLELRQILVRDGKGKRDRYTPLAERLVPRLRAQIRRIAGVHERDVARGQGWAPLPGALHRKHPRAGYELGWQFLFPGRGVTQDPATGRTGRAFLHPSAVQRKVKEAIRRSGLPKHATCHTLRHSFATEALRGGCDIRLLQHVMGHKDVRTTMIYLHVVEQTGHYIRSPLDRPSDPEIDEDDPVGRPHADTSRHP